MQAKLNYRRIWTIARYILWILFGVATIVMGLLSFYDKKNYYSFLGAVIIGLGTIYFAGIRLWGLDYFDRTEAEENEADRRDVSLRKAKVESLMGIEEVENFFPQNYTVEFYAGNQLSYLWMDHDANKLEKLYEYTNSRNPQGCTVRILEVLGLFAFGHPTEDKFIFAQEGFLCQEFTYQEFVRHIYEIYGE